MSEEKTLVVAMKVDDMPLNPIPSVRLRCSGGCGDDVWVDKKLKSLWFKVPVLCMDCALEKFGSKVEDVSFVIAPESIEALMMMRFLINRYRSRGL